MNLETIKKAEASLGWYLVNTGGHAERLAKFHLGRQGFQVYLPMRAVRNKTADHAAPMFPRYLFVQLDPVVTRWDVVRSTIGVVSIVKSAGSIARVPAAWISKLREREVFGLVTLNEAAPDAEPGFVVGERLRVNSGQFAGFDAVFDRACSDARRIHILLTLFGRVSGVDIARTQCRAAGG